jgi:hypothetical protein
MESVPSPHSYARDANDADPAIAEERAIFVQNLLPIFKLLSFYFFRVTALYFEVIEGGYAVGFCP